MTNTKFFGLATRATFACGVMVLVMPIGEARAQRSPHTVDRRARVLVAGQPDSASLAFTEAIRQGLQQSSPSLLFVPQAAIDLVRQEAYRAADSPIAFNDMRELGKLVRADLVIGLIPISASRDSLTIVMLAPPNRVPRTLGQWSVERASRLRIVDAIEADSSYLRVRNQ